MGEGVGVLRAVGVGVGMGVIVGVGVGEGVETAVVQSVRSTLNSPKELDMNINSPLPSGLRE